MEIIWNGSSLYYEKAGTGDHPLLLFHGFGQDHTVFGEIVETNPQSFVYYSFDLFFHGKSRWRSSSESLTDSDIKEIFSSFFAKENITRFSVLGFSIGCRLALALLNLFPDRAARLILVAPDSIKRSFWYSLATGTPFGRRILKNSVSNPQVFTQLLRLGKKMKVVDGKLLHLAEIQMSTKERRERVASTWLLFRMLKPHLTALANSLNKNHVELTVVVGERDKIVSPNDLKGFLALVDHKDFRMVSSGHYNTLKFLPKILADITIRSGSRR